MKKDHNPNYHDMAVKNAIKGYEDFIEEYEKEMEENMEYDQEDKIYEDEIEEEDQASQIPEIQISKKREFIKVLYDIFSHYLTFLILELSLGEQIYDAFLDLYNDVLEAFGLSEYVIHKSERQFSRPLGDSKSKGN